MLKNYVIVSDIHAGCRFALYPDTKIKLDSGGNWKRSPHQKKLWKLWRIFWDQWVPTVTRGEPFGIVINGDSLDGAGHHGSVTQISQNLVDQREIAYQIIAPLLELKNCKALLMVRGTEAHVGKSHQDEEELAKRLKAIPDEMGNHARNDLWLRVGTALCHIVHHIGTTGSMAYETTALMKEYTESCAEAGRWNRETPDIVVRSHRHRQSEIKVPTDKGYGICFTTPGWQMKTPFTFKIPGGRLTQPQIGGSLIRQGDEEFYVRHRVWSLDRSKEVKL